MNIPPRQDYHDDEVEPLSEPEFSNDVASRIDFTSDDEWQEQYVSDDESTDEYIAPAAYNHIVWYWKVMGVALMIMILWPITHALIQLVTHPWQVDQLFSIALVVVSLIFLTLLGREIWLVHCFRGQQKFSLNAKSMGNRESRSVIIKQCSKLIESMDFDAKAWQAQLKEYYEVQEILESFEQHVLQRQDQKVKALILRNASQSSVMLALSPYATLDMLLMAWRNLVMMRQIARLYGLNTGIAMQAVLVKSVLVNIAFAGASQVVADLGIEMAGTNLTRKLSASVADGLSAGLLTARLGYQCLHICRPLPMTRSKLPRLAKIQRRLLTDLVNLIGKR